jgi:SAM-dependent methyltransferase
LSFLEREHGLDTAGLVRNPALTSDGTPYYAIAPSIFNAICAQWTFDLSGFTFLDFGSGKGRALFLAAARPFRRIIGIEISPELHRIALSNIARFPSASPIDSILADAALVPIPAGPLIAFFYNPFGAGTMSKVLRNLKDAHERTGQRIEIAYFTPVFEALFDAQPWLHKTGTPELALTADEATHCVLGVKTFRVALYSTCARS